MLANRPARTPNSPQRRKGFTLAESLAAVVITSGMLVASLNLVGGAVQARRARASMGTSKHLAMDLLWEIISASYQEPVVAVEETVNDGDGGLLEINPLAPVQTILFGTEADEADGTRKNFDDIDDYDGWSSSPPQTKDGTNIAGYNAWTRSVSIQYRQLSDPRIASGSETGLRAIRVTVTDPNGRSHEVEALRAGVGTFDQEPCIQSDFVSWIGLELQPTGVPDPIFGGAGSINHAE